MQYAAGGMDAQRSALDVLARNVAMTQTADARHPVRPLEPQFAIATGDDDDAPGDDASFASALASVGGTRDDDAVAFGGDDDGAEAALPGSVAFAGARPGARVVTGADAVGEMVAVLGAQRAYEADASIFDTGKRLVERTLDVERT